MGGRKKRKAGGRLGRPIPQKLGVGERSERRLRGLRGPSPRPGLVWPGSLTVGRRSSAMRDRAGRRASRPRRDAARMGGAQGSAAPLGPHSEPAPLGSSRSPSSGIQIPRRSRPHWAAVRSSHWLSGRHSRMLIG